MTVETDHDNHVDEITEEHRCVNISNEHRFFYLPVEFNDWFHKVRMPK